jgi:4-hydroxyphenylpyruvate dioxygenase
VRRAQHPAVGVILDSFHVLARGHVLTTISTIPRDRIVLVQLADAPRDFFGSGVQHIALATSDNLATVERMRASGVAMLAVPDNYCDDLETRADLPPGLLHRLRTLDILYDRDEHGPFLQAYTATLEGGFFFEIVQRDGYTGYGAANAAIRLAAQAWAARSLEMPRT